jgi:hypothetical protein
MALLAKKKVALVTWIAKPAIPQDPQEKPLSVLVKMIRQEAIPRALFARPRLAVSRIEWLSSEGPPRVHASCPVQVKKSKRGPRLVPLGSAMAKVKVL